jgi:NitT/TauT family transport system substrate-binding protein
VQGVKVIRTVFVAAIGLILATLPASASTKINFIYTPVNQFVALYVAKDQGILDKHGIDMDLTTAANGSLIGAALIADTAQIGGPTPTVLLQANEQGLDLVVIAGTEVYPIAGKGGALAASDSGIHGPQELAGKRVGTPGLGGILDVLMHKWVQSSGLDYHKVNWVEIGFPQMSDALKGHLVDAVAAVDPAYTHVLADKTGYSIGSYTDIIPPGTSPVNFVTTRAWATKHVDDIKALQAALDEGVAFVKNPANDAAVRASLAKYTHLPPPVVAMMAVPQNFDVHIKPESLRFWIEVSREQGLIKGNPDPKSLIYP